MESAGKLDKAGHVSPSARWWWWWWWWWGVANKLDLDLLHAACSHGPLPYQFCAGEAWGTNHVYQRR